MADPDRMTAPAAQAEAEALVRRAVAARPGLVRMLEVLGALDLPEAAIGAGAVRDAVWDHLSGLPPRPPADVDVLCFDPHDPEGAREAEIEAVLAGRMPGVPWSVRNQARMHLRNGDAPYRSTLDAMRFWLETPTAVALAPDGRGGFGVLAPYGLADLVAMRVRPTPAGRARPGAYRARLEARDWPGRWPGVTVTWPDAPSGD